MRNLLVRSPVIILMGAGLLLGGCASTDSISWPSSVIKAQDTADAAKADAAAAMAAAQKAQSAADAAASAAQAAASAAQTAAADAARANDRLDHLRLGKHHKRHHHRHHPAATKP
jgi:hypothetical protein